MTYKRCLYAASWLSFVEVRGKLTIGHRYIPIGRASASLNRLNLWYRLGYRPSKNPASWHLGASSPAAMPLRRPGATAGPAPVFFNVVNPRGLVAFFFKGENWKNVGVNSKCSPNSFVIHSPNFQDMNGTRNCKVDFWVVTSLKTNEYPLKINGWKMKFLWGAGSMWIFPDCTSSVYILEKICLCQAQDPSTLDFPRGFSLLELFPGLLVETIPERTCGLLLRRVLVEKISRPWDTPGHLVAFALLGSQVGR